MKIPVIINNRDLLTWPKAMVERIKKYDGVGDIYILDNDSSNLDLLEWYKTVPCTIIQTSVNFGHAAPWDSKLVEKIFQDSPYYVVTDSDMGLDNTPDNTLLYLLEKEKELKLGKVGLGLDWMRVKSDSPYYGHMQNYELKRWLKTKIVNNVAVDVPIDTTFALYSVNHYFIGGGSTISPYIARHYPWELNQEEYNKNDEFRYYIEHATDSSSYKRFLGL